MRHNVSGITHFHQYFEILRLATRLEPIRLLVGNRKARNQREVNGCCATTRLSFKAAMLKVNANRQCGKT